MERRTLIAIAVFSILVVLAVVFFAARANNSPSTTPTQETTIIIPTGSTVGESIIVTEQFFSPKAIVLKKGDALELEFKSMIGTKTITAPSLGITREVTSDALTIIKTEPLGAGTITFYCTSGCDQGVSMKVTIE